MNVCCGDDIVFRASVRIVIWKEILFPSRLSYTFGKSCWKIKGKALSATENGVTLCSLHEQPVDSGFQPLVPASLTRCPIGTGR